MDRLKPANNLSLDVVARELADIQHIILEICSIFMGTGIIMDITVITMALDITTVMGMVMIITAMDSETATGKV